MTVAEKNTTNILPKDWKKSENYFTSDDIIKAYLDGKEAGKKEEWNNFRQQFSLNIKLATSIGEELYALTSDQDIKLNAIHLKANSLNSFEILYLVDKDSFLADSFRQAYTIGRELRNKYQTDKFNFSFSFMPDSREDELDCLAADGFFIQYEKGQKA